MDNKSSGIASDFTTGCVIHEWKQFGRFNQFFGNVSMIKQIKDWYNYFSYGHISVVHVLIGLQQDELMRSLTKFGL